MMFEVPGDRLKQLHEAELKLGIAEAEVERLREALREVVDDRDFAVLERLEMPLAVRLAGRVRAALELVPENDGKAA